MAHIYNSRFLTMRKALKAAFPFTIPIFAGFWFLGLTYGVLMNVSGFSFVYPMLMSVLIFTGSVEFLMVNMLQSPFAPLQSFVLAFMVGARHLFYGISMLDRFRNVGRKRIYLIYAMCDETFSINYSAKIPRGVDAGWFMFWVSFLDQLYWVSGATMGGLLGSYVSFDTKGLDFCMTAMFVTIFMDQWLKEKNHFSSVLGILASVACLLIFGPDRFIIFTMLAVLVVLYLVRPRLEAVEPTPKGGEA